MSLKPKNQLAISTFIRKLLIWGFSVFFSLLISTFFMYFSINEIGKLYELEHPIPPGEDDLGIGFVALGYAPIILIIAAILSVFLIMVFKKLFSKLLGDFNE